jgi:hypothetical protein
MLCLINIYSLGLYLPPTPHAQGAHLQGTLKQRRFWLAWILVGAQAWAGANLKVNCDMPGFFMLSSNVDVRASLPFRRAS